MPRFRIQEQILAPPRAVFDFLTSLDSGQKVNARVRKTECLDAQPLKTGAKYSQTCSYQGREITSHYELLEAAPPTYLHLQTERQGIRANYRYALKQLGSGTQLTLSAQVKADGLRNLLAFLVAQVMKRRDRDLLERIELALIKSQSV